MGVVTPTILNSGKAMDLAFELVSIDISHEVNRIPRAQLTLLDGSVARQKFAVSESKFFEPGQEIEIKLRYEGAPNQEKRVFKGIVVSQNITASVQGSQLIVELKAKALALTVNRKNQIYLEKTDDDAIESILSGSGMKKGKLMRISSVHPELVQYYSTDWDFIVSRAEANGMLVTVDNDTVSLLKVDLSAAAKHIFEYGLSEIYAFDLEADMSHQYPEIHSSSWDIKNQKLTTAVKAKDFKLAQGNLQAEKLVKTVGIQQQNFNNSVPLSPEENQAWSDAEMFRNRMAFIRGRIAVAGLSEIALLDVIELAGMGERFNGKAVVTGIRHRVDQQGWQTDLQTGLSPMKFAEQRDIIDVPAAGLVPAVNGLQLGIVEQFEEDPENELRVKIMLPALGEENNKLWARLTSPDAGAERGFFFRPEVGDEVVVGFFNDDPRQPVILGAMFGSKNTAPPIMAELSEDNLKKGIVTKSGTILCFIDDAKSSVYIETPEKNKILLDDDTERIELSDQHGNTITMSADGIEMKSAKDFKIEASGDVEIKGAKVDIK
ncbi:MAG: type VI secretion system tip protein VgrG [Calditrichaeota bacterium]|nr:MAG: type VI secretion system tip protein VgrG [Calditrichota bacterium]